jgi:DNA-binding IscR family transcriptional regulator
MRTVRECVLDYMALHKTPVTAKKLAKHYILSDSSVLRVLKELSAEGKVEAIPSKPVQYKLK